MLTQLSTDTNLGTAAGRALRDATPVYLDIVHVLCTSSVLDLDLVLVQPPPPTAGFLDY